MKKGEGVVRGVKKGVRVVKSCEVKRGEVRWWSRWSGSG